MKLREKLETICAMLRAGIPRGQSAKAMSVNKGTLSTISIMLKSGYKKRKARKTSAQED